MNKNTRPEKETGGYRTRLTNERIKKAKQRREERNRRALLGLLAFVSFLLAAVPVIHWIGGGMGETAREETVAVEDNLAGLTTTAVQTSADLAVSDNETVAAKATDTAEDDGNSTAAGAEVTRYFTYGTSFCMDGTLQLTEGQTLKLLTVVLQEEALQAKESLSYCFDTEFSQADQAVEFAAYNSITDGICLEELEEGKYRAILEALYEDGTSEYFQLSNQSGTELPICYYTMTRDGENDQIEICFDTENEEEYLEFLVTECTLPEEVYDIVLDAGHGGTDVGAVNGGYYESEIVLDYALKLEETLEAAGFKVKLTRDGTEEEDTAMAYTMYDEDGRVNVACASGAKYCLSLHLNSNEEYLSSGGVQIYTSCRGGEAFASLLVSNISDAVGIQCSAMETYRICDGVYARAFSESDILESLAAAEESGYAPYEITTDTDYYYMIRELGGIATNAYTDGRNLLYGTNLYRDSIQGVESYILELGFISVESDLYYLLNEQDAYIEAIVESFLAV